MKRKEFEATIRESITKAKEMGWSIRQGITKDDCDKHVCAIGAWGVANAIAEDEVYDISRRMGITTTQTESFIDGFDGRAHGCERHPKWYKLGQVIWNEASAEPAPVG